MGRDRINRGDVKPKSWWFSMLSLLFFVITQHFPKPNAPSGGSWGSSSAPTLLQPFTNPVSEMVMCFISPKSPGV